MPATVERSRSRGEIEAAIRVGGLKGVTAWGSLVRQRATLKAPVDTGRLARSVDLGAAQEASNLVFTVDVGTNVEYARAQEFGSGLHSEDQAYRHLIPIRARRKKALAFEWPGGPTDHPAYDAKSGLFFFRAVMHPGVPAHPYLRPALRETAEDGPRLVVSAIAAELRVG